MALPPIATMNIKPNFALSAVSGIIHPTPWPNNNPLGPLAQLVGPNGTGAVWKGKGFNQIWRPFHGSQDRFLELNETDETLTFEDIPGLVPNRGLLQGDMNLKAIRYLQQVDDAIVKVNGQPAGLHIEPGLWLNVPPTTNPADGGSVARMGSIPHGTTIIAQGSSTQPAAIAGPPPIAPTSIIPFVINQPNNHINFPEQNLGVPSAFRTPHADIPNVTQAMVNNPNIVLVNALAGHTVLSTTTMIISTKAPVQPFNTPTTGGGTSNIAFIQGAQGGPNAFVPQIDAIFWIEEVKLPTGAIQWWLQYTQTVLLNFNGLSWPHVSVATLIRQ